MSVPWDAVRVWSVESAGNFDRDMEVRTKSLVDFRPIWLDLIVRAINGTAASLVQRVLEQQDQTRFAQREGRHFCAPELHQPFRNRIGRWRDRSFGCPVVPTPTYGSSN